MTSTGTEPAGAALAAGDCADTSGFAGTTEGGDLVADVSFELDSDASLGIGQFI